MPVHEFVTSNAPLSFDHFTCGAGGGGSGAGGGSGSGSGSGSGGNGSVGGGSGNGSGGVGTGSGSGSGHEPRTSVSLMMGLVMSVLTMLPRPASGALKGQPLAVSCFGECCNRLAQ